MTSGSTLDRLARAILAAGAIEVQRWVMARAVLRKIGLIMTSNTNSGHATKVQPDTQINNHAINHESTKPKKREAAMYTISKLTLLLCTLNLIFGSTAQALVVHDQSGRAVVPRIPFGVTDLVPTGKGWGQRPITGEAKGQGGGTKYTNGINYHNGPLILGSAHVYYIWYGNWSGNTAPTILNNFASLVGGSPYYDINTTYYDVNKNFVSNAVVNMGAGTDNYSQGTALSDASVKTVVANQISSGSLPRDTNAVYFVLTSADVTETSGFCTQYCGWHTHGSIAGADIKYAFVGNPDQCPSACSAQTTSPNGNAGADGMANIIGHELEEAVTDPDLNAWYDSQGMENADKCAWTFGTTYTTSNGAKANMSLGGVNYLIQQNWVNAKGGYCALSYP